MSAQLTTLQTWFMRSLVYPRSLQQEQLTTYLKQSPQLSADKQFLIYQRSYILRLCKCLQEQFPALTYCLGKDLFDEFARDYLRSCPSTSHSLYDLGSRFTRFLEDNRPDKSSAEQHQEPWIDFMVDLSRYEFELFRLFDAPGHEGQQLPTIDSDDDQLQLQSCLSLGQYQFPVAHYYHQVRDQKNPGLPDPRKTYVVILRKDYQTSTFPVSHAHYNFLCALKQTNNIDTAIQNTAKQFNRTIDSVYQSWQNNIRNPWINSGFFIYK